MAMTAHFLDDLFAEETDATTLAEKLVKQPRFLEALAKGLESEAESKQTQTSHPGIAGPGYGQSGRAAFLRSLNEDNLTHNRADNIDAA